MKNNFKLFLFFLAVIIVPALCQATTTILSSTSPNHTVTSGSDEKVYGTNGSNIITLESGARAELINFPGYNQFNIASSSTLFAVSRSGTMVFFQGSDGTSLKIPATSYVQTISFGGEAPMVLTIHNNQVMLDDQVIGTEQSPVTGESGHAEVIFQYDFESGWGDWYVDNGVWEIGVPTVGPEECHSGTQCAGTVLDGNYYTYSTTRLISPSVRLPCVTGDEELHVRFWQWFVYSQYSNGGKVQISVYDEQNNQWLEWESLNSVWIKGTSREWTLVSFDITKYACKKIKIAFLHSPDDGSSTGWYIDDVTITGAGFDR